MAAKPPSPGLTAGGYFVTRPIERPPHVSAELVPPRVLTVSSCLATLVPDTWALSWVKNTQSERLQELRAAGLPDASLSRVMSWVTKALDAGTFGWPNLFPSLDAARRFTAEFLPPGDESVILGIGLPESTGRRFLSTEKPEAEASPPGVFSTLSLSQPLAAGGEHLGIELLGYEFTGQFHSWLCSGLEVLVAKRFAVRPNANGFLDAPDEAERAAAAITQEGLGEPARWDPWHIVRYTR